MIMMILPNAVLLAANAEKQADSKFAIQLHNYVLNLYDYVLAGRRLSGPITALAAGASDMGSWLLMALPGLVYVNGLKTLWLPVV